MDEVLNSRQRRAPEGVLDGMNIQGAAARAGINRKTLSRWLSEPSFWQAYRTASDAGLQTAARRLAAQMDGAVDVLVAVRDDEDAPPGVRLRAAQLVIESGLRLLDAVDISERLAALEDRLNV